RSRGSEPGALRLAGTRRRPPRWPCPLAPRRVRCPPGATLTRGVASPPDPRQRPVPVQPVGVKYDALTTGCGAAWLARLTGGQEVAGSNPASPTRKSRSEALSEGGAHAVQGGADRSRWSLLGRVRGAHSTPVRAPKRR